MCFLFLERVYIFENMKGKNIVGDFVIWVYFYVVYIDKIDILNNNNNYLLFYSLL